MSDTVPDTADKAIRDFLGAIAFTLVLIGGEMMAEKDGLRFWTGTLLVFAAIPVYLSGALWKTVKPHLNKETLDRVDAVVNRAPWWSRGLFIVLLALVISQTIGQIKWPFLPITDLAQDTAPPGGNNYRWQPLSRSESLVSVRRLLDSLESLVIRWCPS
jgi:hypothetical protein